MVEKKNEPNIDFKALSSKKKVTVALAALEQRKILNQKKTKIGIKA